ncbi:ornithine--oxo-acid transaminase [Streptomyces sp. MJP52]|nr:ornithine--oxo-acid transaminase [Streptomyces sp. MJP52]
MTGFDLAALLEDRSAERYALHERYLNHQLPRMLRTLGFDKVYERAEGAYFWDAEGNDYLDMLAGFGVMGLGRHHPVVRKALHDVLDARLADLARFDCSPLPGLLAERLLAHSPHLDRVFFGNSGTEAVETALKFARRATGRPRVLHCDHAFHGLTAGSLSVNGETGFRDGFGPLLPDTAVPLGDLTALERELARGDVAALIVEPVQGKGVHEAPPGYLRAAQELLHRHRALLIADEVQTGLGRTGDFYAYQHEEGVEPDLVCVAKALSGGYVPVGATLGKDWIFKKVYSSMDRVLVHSASFGSNAQAMAAGLAVLSVIEDDQIVAGARATGELLRSRLAALTDRLRAARRRAGAGPDDRHRVRPPALAQAAGEVGDAAGGAQGALRADGGGAAAATAPDPHPGLRRPPRGDQADPAPDHRRTGGRPLRHGLHGGDGRRPRGGSRVGLRPPADEAGGEQPLAVLPRDGAPPGVRALLPLRQTICPQGKKLAE